MKFHRDFPILLSFYPRLSASNALHLLIKGKLSEIYIRCIFKEKTSIKIFDEFKTLHVYRDLSEIIILLCHILLL